MGRRMGALAGVVLAMGLLGGCDSAAGTLACRSVVTCLKQWDSTYDQRALTWLKAHPDRSRRTAIGLLLSPDYRDREYGEWLVTLAGLEDDARIHAVVAKSLELGPEAAGIHKTPSNQLPGLERTLELANHARPRDQTYARLAGKFGPAAIKALETRIRCRPACARFDPEQARAIVSAVMADEIYRLPVDTAIQSRRGSELVTPIIALANDESASDTARLEARVLLASRLQIDRPVDNETLTALLRRFLASEDLAQRRDAMTVLLDSDISLVLEDWRRITGEMEQQNVSLDVLPWNPYLDRSLPPPLGKLLRHRLLGPDSSEALKALNLLTDHGDRQLPDDVQVDSLLHNPDPELAAQTASILIDSGASPDTLRMSLQNHWFPTTATMLENRSPAPENYQRRMEMTCGRSLRRMTDVRVSGNRDNSSVRMASRELQTNVAYAAKAGPVTVASVFHGEFGGYLAVFRAGQAPEILGYEPFGPILDLGENRFLVTSGVAHMGSLSGDVYELEVGPHSSRLIHRLGGLSQPLALERRKDRLLLSTYAFGVIDVTDLNAPRWLGCEQSSRH